MNRAGLTPVLRIGRLSKTMPTESKFLIWQGDAGKFLDALPKRPIFDLVVTSPPYNLGKEYEARDALAGYLGRQSAIIKPIVQRLKRGGSLCWQVGNYVDDGEILPLDIELHPIFRSMGLQLRNRIIWRFGHGLHNRRRFSGRYEVVLWYTKGDDYVFDLDAVRVPSKYPGKRHYKGRKKGEYSSHPLGKNPEDVWDMDLDVWNIPNVKNNHIEKKIHPCQFPVGLCERLVVALSKPGGLVFDPFAGVGTTGVAAALRQRRFWGCERQAPYARIAQQRIRQASAGDVKYRPFDKPVYDHFNSKLSVAPERLGIRILRADKEEEAVTLILGWPFPKRVGLLQELAPITTGRTHALRFQSKLQHFQIHSVPIELPKYRLKNGRTAAAQVEYLATHPAADKDLFTSDPEAQEAQKVQHALLKAVVDQSGLFDYFKTHDQELPMILTPTGFIVNGNRRVCAMRELLEDDRGKFQRFQNIEIVILPPSSESDIDWLEGKEQIHKDITADYSWATTAVMYRTRMNEHHQDLDYVAELYEIEKTEVSAMLDMLAHAEAYLKDRNKEGHYSLVEGREYAFRQLRKFRTKLDSEAKKEVYDQISYAVIDDPEGDRAYQAVADVSKHFTSVVSTLQAEFGLTGQQLSTVTGGDLLGGGPGKTVAAVLAVLRDDKKREKVRDVVREVLASENEKARERKKENFVFSRIKKSGELLSEAVQARRDDTPKTGIAELLDSIDESVSGLRKWLHGKSVH